MDDEIGRDPAFISRLCPVMDGMLAYFDPEIEGFENLPEHGPMLVVSNHSGGMYMPDLWAFLRHWIRVRGLEDPLYFLGFDFTFAVPGIRGIVPRLGVVPANHDNAQRLLERGCSVMVYPGGDQDDYRPWTERHRVDLRGHMGFVRLALREQVPLVPVVSHGSHDAIHVLARGDGIAHRLGLDRLLRIKVLPLVAGLPWGVAPAPLPTVPLPAKVTVRVCPPIEWRYGPEAAEDPVAVRHCYEEVLGRMQANLDELVAVHPHPVLDRVRDPARRGSLHRHDRP